MGGVICHPNYDENDVQSLAMMMSVKTGIANLPFAGAKGLIVCDPRELSYREMERLSRSYIRALYGRTINHNDILTSEGQANTQMMAWMYDELSYFNENANCVIMGKPYELGGTYSREKAMAISLITTINETLKRNQLNLQDTSIVIDGFGKVGSFLAQYVHQKGAKVVGLSDQYGGLYEEDGLDIDYLLDRRDSFGTVTKLFKKSISVEELREKTCDVLLLASEKPDMKAINFENLDASIVIEATNHFMTLSQTNKLTQKGVVIVPNLLATVGNEIISNLEWIQAKQGYRWSADEVEQKLKAIMVQSFEDVSYLANSRKVDLQLASYMYSYVY